METPKPAEILEFRFGDARAAPQQVRLRSELWFRRNEEFDRQIQDRFGSLPEQAARGELDPWREGMLAGPAPAQGGTMSPDDTPRVRFYFDYISSNAYLAWLELPRLASRTGAEFEMVPVLFAGLLEAHGQLGPAEVPAKAHWMWKNNLRKAALLGAPLNPPAFHPFNPLLALRISSLCSDESRRTALIDGLFKAVWVEQRHVSEPEVVRDVAARAGLDGARLVAEAGTPESKARLRAQTDQAIAAGVFGVPSMLVGEELFWGYDDLPYLERLLAGADPLAPGQVSKSNAPPPSAVRRRFRPDGEDA